MMAKNLKRLEYLKYHNPDNTLPASERASVDWKMVCLIPTNIKQFLIHILTKNTMKISHLIFDCSTYTNEGIKGDFYMA